MGLGGSLLLIAVGAILRWAVSATTSGVNLQTIGLILLIVGGIGLVISLMWMAFIADRTPRAPRNYVDGPVTYRSRRGHERRSQGRSRGMRSVLEHSEVRARAHRAAGVITTRSRPPNRTRRRSLADPAHRPGACVIKSLRVYPTVGRDARSWIGTAERNS